MLSASGQQNSNKSERYSQSQSKQQQKSTSQQSSKNQKHLQLQEQTSYIPMVINSTAEGLMAQNNQLRQQYNSLKCEQKFNNKLAADQQSLIDDTTPLLDTSNEIEQRSQDWPIEPDSDDSQNVSSYDRLQNGMRLAHPFGKTKRMLIEVFIMVNLAQLMYTAMLAFSKQALLQQGSLGGGGVHTTSLCLYRSLVLLAIAGFKQAFYWSWQEDDHQEGSKNAVIGAKEREQQTAEAEQAQGYTATASTNTSMTQSATIQLAQTLFKPLMHGFLMFGATVSLLVSLTILPICYCALAIHTASCLCGNIFWAFRWCRSRSSTSDINNSGISQQGALVIVLSLLVKTCAGILFLYTQVPRQQLLKQGVDVLSTSPQMASDPLLEQLQKRYSMETQYQIALVFCFASGVFLSLGHYISKQSNYMATSAWKSQDMLISLTFKLCLSAVLFFAFLEQDGKLNKQDESNSSSGKQLASQFFWIGLFSITAKAAMSLSYNGGGNGNDAHNNDSNNSNNPLHCKIMCLIGLAYCAFVDCQLFKYVFEPIQIALGLAITVMTLIMLAIHSNLYEKMRERRQIMLSNQQSSAKQENQYNFQVHGGAQDRRKEYAKNQRHLSRTRSSQLVMFPEDDQNVMIGTF